MLERSWEWWSEEGQSGAGRVETGVQGPFDVAREDFHSSFGPLAENGFESAARSPAAAP